jgi:hypothetical protein
MCIKKGFLLTFLLGSISQAQASEPLIYPHDDSKYASIKIVSATYGGNCGAKTGNATKHIALKCGGKEYCDYIINYRLLGDPVPGCVKDYVVNWTCGIYKDIMTQKVETKKGDAGMKQKILITCGIN